MPQVFGCPHCQNPFQVPDDAAGQTFECPTCNTAVEVPADEVQQQTSRQPEPEIFECPHCSGQFGIDESMYGQQLSCPHCDNLVLIGDAPDTATPEIRTEEPIEVVDEVPDFEPEQPVFEEAPNEDAGQPAVLADEASVPPKQRNRTRRSSKNKRSKLEPKTNAKAEAETQPAPETRPKPDAQAEPATESEPVSTPAPESEPAPESAPVPVFQPQPVDHLLPPAFNVPDPVRFPARLGSDEVILPDGKGGYKKVDANIVTITHNGEVYQLKRLTPQQRRQRSFIHNTIAIGIAVLLIYLTLKTIGVLS